MEEASFLKPSSCAERDAPVMKVHHCGLVNYIIH